MPGVPGHIVRRAIQILFLAIILLGLNLPSQAAEGLTGALQQGLFEEEANRNLDKAIEAYQSLVTQFDKDRQIGATAVFRLGECYRKLGRTNEAILQYERVVREFPDQTTLATLSRQNLTGLGKVSSGVASPKSPDGNASVSVTIDDEESEIRRMQTLLKTSPDLLNSTTGDNSWTPLQSAAANGRARLAQFLLDSGADVSGGSGRKPLTLAAESGHKALVELLLRHGAPVDGSNGEEWSPLHFAVEKDRRAVVEALLAAKASVEVRARSNYRKIISGDTPLCVACRGGDKLVVEQLLKSGAKAEVVNGSESPLGLVIRSDRPDLTALLLKNGANPNSPASFLPLRRAIERGIVDTVKLLLEAGADPNGVGEQKVPLLFRALERDGPALDEVVALMLKAGAKIDVTGNKEALEPGRNSNSNPGNQRLILPLHYAAIRERTNSMTLLLQQGADMESRTADGYSPLDFAVQFNSTGAAALLIARGADVNRRDPTGITPLWQACGRGNLVVARLLLEAKADPNVVAPSGTTLLESVSSADVVALLKQFGTRDDFPRWDQIRLSRGFGKPSNWWTANPSFGWDRHTLLELIAAAVPSFPDLASVRILRPQKDGENSQVIPVNVEALLAAGDRTRDPWLEWGDVVEIGGADHPLNSPWNGFDKGTADKLLAMLTGQATVICGGKTNQLRLATMGYRTLNGVIPGVPGPTTYTVNLKAWTSARVIDSGLLRTSSDLGRVTVRRIDPITRKPVDQMVDGTTWIQPGGVQHGTPPTAPPLGLSEPLPLATPPTAPGIRGRGGNQSVAKPGPEVITDVWLRDGDVIEVPEKAAR